MPAQTFINHRFPHKRAEFACLQLCCKTHSQNGFQPTITSVRLPIIFERQATIKSWHVGLWQLVKVLLHQAGYLICSRSPIRREIWQLLAGCLWASTSNNFSIVGRFLCNHQGYPNPRRQRSCQFWRIRNALIHPSFCSAETPRINPRRAKIPSTTLRKHHG